ncbi:hypothetical protein [Novosphingobium album (ex Hu et al. 2023)]|uniref:Lipoprotein n=1 Tax=Novosphingobium album (ex Hu et al. 2023) TaxID=2930093 RepID=A0ABT0B383_9SPHN|nr:hypothetical protein [Novosphingobium album (ex Hu et al. 2023)]MCJ2179343.1 hypothetical protein [Novosphingobium album (ex Hu et al. 2023)]
MKGWTALAVLLVAGCGGPDDSAPAQPPAGFHIGKADLTRAAPNDICQSRDAAFLRNLILRVTSALPPGTQGFDFEDFNVAKVQEGEAMEAVLRFKSTGADGHPQMMYAFGPFDPATCAIGPMTGGAGTTPHAAGAMETFHVGG